jgi:hypothetical protein
MKVISFVGLLVNFVVLLLELPIRSVFQVASIFFVFGTVLFESVPVSTTIRIDRQRVILSTFGRKREIPLALIRGASSFTLWQGSRASLVGVRISMIDGQEFRVPLGRKGWFSKRGEAIVAQITEALETYAVAHPPDGRDR